MNIVLPEEKNRSADQVRLSRQLKTSDMEIRLASHFNPRVNLVVPNVSWGFLPHEADLLVMTKAGFLYEIEIKVSLSDLRADSNKTHCHECRKVKHLYFAIPEWMLEKGLEHIPTRAGILVVCGTQRKFENLLGTEILESPIFWHVREVRPPQKTSDYKLTTDEKFEIARLGALRIWPLKRAANNRNQGVASNG